VRFTGANHSSDVERLDAWFERLTEWKNQGIENIQFFHPSNHRKGPSNAQRAIGTKNE
jgi:hypothetical protein